MKPPYLKAGTEVLDGTPYRHSPSFLSDFEADLSWVWPGWGERCLSLCLEL